MKKMSTTKKVLIGIGIYLVVFLVVLVNDKDWKNRNSSDPGQTSAAPTSTSTSKPKEVAGIIEIPAVEVPKAAEKPSPSFREVVNKSIADSQKEAIKNAHKAMIDRSLRQYEIVKRQGSATDVCIHANAIQGAYLGAEDEANYAKWRVIAQNDCKVAGVPTL